MSEWDVEKIRSLSKNGIVREVTELKFLGTGSSGGVPKLSCLTEPNPSCATCLAATLPGNPNNRRNTSVIIHTKWFGIGLDDIEIVVKDRFVMIDCGKSFLQSAIAYFQKLEITRLDAIILTHGHADACFGLDDLRSLTTKENPLDIYIRDSDVQVIQGVFPYLMPDANHSRYVTSLNIHIFDPKEPVQVCGLTLTPLEVNHGPNYICLGYAFGDVVYMSDLNHIYPHTKEYLNKTFKPYDNTDPTDTRKPLGILVIDALYPKNPYPSHLSLTQAVEHILEFRPKNAYTVGMSHYINHEKSNEELAKYQDSHLILIQLAYDGLVVPMNL